MESVYSLLPEDFAALSPPNSPSFLFSRVHRIASWTDGQPTLGRDGRAFLSRFCFALPEIVHRASSSDGATKVLLRMEDGRDVEAVHMPRAVKNPRVTLCISSQIGCALGCTFCNTARMGLVRNLTASEIIGQVLVLLREFGPDDTTRVSVVFMGMGEPLHNVEAVLRAVKVLQDTRGLGIPLGRITVSTAGLVPGILRLSEADFRPAFALSMNATTDEARARTMPIGAKYGLAELREAILAVKLRPHEKVIVGYVLLLGENDTPDDARRLADFVRPFRHVVNVIPYNVFDGSRYREVDREETLRFVSFVRDHGALVTVRRSRGRDVSAACGQLITARAAKGGPPVAARESES